VARCRDSAGGCPNRVKLSIGASNGLSACGPQELLLWEEEEEVVPEWEEGCRSWPCRWLSAARAEPGCSGAAEDAAEAAVDLALRRLAGQCLAIHRHDAPGRPRLQAESPDRDVVQVGTVQVQVGPLGHGQEELQQRHAADASRHVEEVDAAVMQLGCRCHQQVGAQVGLVDGIDGDELLLGHHGPVCRHRLAQRHQQRVGGQSPGRLRPRRRQDTASLAVAGGRLGVPGCRRGVLLGDGGQVGEAALVDPQLGQALEGAQGEAGVAQPAVLLALDVHIRDETPAEAEEGEEALTRGRAQRDQVHLRVQPLAQDEGAVCQQLLLCDLIIAVRDGEDEFGLDPARGLSCCPNIYAQPSPTSGWDISQLGDSVPRGQLLGVGRTNQLLEEGTELGLLSQGNLTPPPCSGISRALAWLLRGEAPLDSEPGEQKGHGGSWELRDSVRCSQEPAGCGKVGTQVGTPMPGIPMSSTLLQGWSPAQRPAPLIPPLRCQRSPVCLARSCSGRSRGARAHPA